MKKYILALFFVPMLSQAVIYECKELSFAPINADGSVNFSATHLIPQQPTPPIRVSFTGNAISITDGIGSPFGASNDWISMDNKSLQSFEKKGNDFVGKVNMGEMVNGGINWNVAGFIGGNKFYITTATGLVTLASGCAEAE